MTFKAVGLILFTVLLSSCGGGNTPPSKPPVDPTVEACAQEKIDCKDFFAFEPGAVQLSYLELIAQWNKSKQLYISGRPGLTPEEIQTVNNLKLGALFIVHAWPPVAWRHVTAVDGHETDIALLNSPDGTAQVQGYFSGSPFPMINYANPYCLPCEYFHYFELVLRGGVQRDPEYRTHEGEAVWEVIGHCTPDDVMNFCCYKTTAYDVPAGR